MSRPRATPTSSSSCAPWTPRTARSCRCARAGFPAPCTCTTWRSSAGACTPTRSARTRSSPWTTTRAGSASGGRASIDGPRLRGRTTCSSTRSPRAPTSRARTSPPRPTPRRPAGPGHRNFAVDGRGVVFSGATRAVVGRGLTRPHSARIHDGRLWVDNSGYGEVGVIEDGRFAAVARLPGWTRGLAAAGGRLWVATSTGHPALSPVRARAGRRPKRLRSARDRPVDRHGRGEPHLAGGQPGLRGGGRAAVVLDGLPVHSPDAAGRHPARVFSTFPEFPS